MTPAAHCHRAGAGGAQGDLMKETLLNGTWELHDEPLATGAADAERLAGLAEGWIAQPVPGDIHQGLMDAGRIKDPLLGLNSFDCRWTEDRSWWFRRRFATQPEWLSSDAVELELNGLDSNATIFLNGAYLGDHKNAFYPFVTDVKKHLSRDGENTLLVRLTAGVEDVTQEQLQTLGVPVGTEAGNGRPERGDSRRAYVRKPQYTFGWDWSPRAATTAIAGDVKVRAWDVACIRDVRIQPQRAGKGVLLNVTITVDSWHYFSTSTGTVKLTLTDEDRHAVKAEWSGLLRSGLNPIELPVSLEQARLWWPNGLGEQHRYTVSAELTCASSRAPDVKARAAYPAFKYGVRFVELDLGDPVNGQDLFAFVVNGKRIFSKGGDWIPADTIYARASAERYDRLVYEAQQANINMLRVWGGGLYEPEAFYDACDRYGILLWHDFMFACAPYPDHEPWFREEVRREAEYQTRRLRSHACMALWSGSNENNWGFDEWWSGQTSAGAYLYNELLPAVVHANCAEIPYWNGSPFGGAKPNSAEVGDRHHWFDCMMNPDMQKRITPEEYDKCASLFISEYGYIGAPAKESVVQYLDGAPFDRQSQVWQHHNNTFEKHTVEAGIRKHYADPDKITLDEYFLYSGLTQGLMYGYSLDTFRSHPYCHGGLIWMYADCWGEVGWTVIDYYLRRKISWYFVRRALSPLRLILRYASDQVEVTLANDTAEKVAGTLEFGCVSLDGADQRLREKSFTCPPLARKVIATFKQGSENPCENVWFARVKGDPAVWPALLRAVDMRSLKMAQPHLKVKLARAGKGLWRARVGSDVFAHGVHLGLPAGAVAQDDYFDLLPGETRDVLIASGQPLSAQDVTLTSVVCAGA
jgi:beta-mannosidase